VHILIFMEYLLYMVYGLVQHCYKNKKWEFGKYCRREGEGGEEKYFMCLNGQIQVKLVFISPTT